MIYTLSVVGLARTLLWVIGIYFIAKILSRLFAPFLLRFAAKKMEKRFGEQFGTNQIDKMPSNNTSSNKKVGEYIDYEEIE